MRPGNGVMECRELIAGFWNRGILLPAILLMNMAVFSVYGNAATKVQVNYSNNGITIAGKGKAIALIVLGKDAVAPEKTAAKELAEYLKKATGVEFKVVREGEEKQTNNLIYVGPTKYAVENGLDSDLLGEEQWIIRTVNNNLILTGGRPRGTLYAVYHFLEDVVGVRWWSPWEEFVPANKQLATGKLDLSGEPAFRVRQLDISGSYGGWFRSVSNREDLYAPRNRINSRINPSINMPEEYGGVVESGPPDFCHAEGHYFDLFKRRGDLEKHPDWVALIDGKREIRKEYAYTQFCLSNPELRRAVLEQLRTYIRETRKQANPPMVFDFSGNDVPGVCQCENCQAVVKKYGGKDAGLWLETVNYLADGIKDDYPEVLISTFAYLTTEEVPVGIVPRDNVMIVLCDTRSSYAQPIARDGYFARCLRDWAKITEKIRVWDYHSNFSDPALPMPYESTFQADLQLFRKYHVSEYMTQYHHVIYEDMRDLRLWLLAKLMEDPYRDQNQLIKDFTDGFYGPAAVHIREYLALLQDAAAKSPSVLFTSSMTSSVRYLTPDFVSAAQKIFDQAEQAAGKSDILQRRVRHARLGIDKATVTVFPRLWQAWAQAGNKPEKIPFDREKIAARVKQTVEEQWQLRAPGEGQWWGAGCHKKQTEDCKKNFLGQIDTALKKKLVVIKPPSKFKDLPEGGYTDYPADSISTGYADLVIEDVDSEAGIAVKKVFTEQEMLSQEYPITTKKFARDYVLAWDLHNYQKSTAKGDEPTIVYLKPADVSEPGYQWYKLGSYHIEENSFLWVYNANLEVPMRAAIDPLEPSAAYDIWVRLKFEGPAFPHGTADQANAVFVERIVVIKKGLLK